MIGPSDLRAAVGAGLLTEAQAASLIQLSHARAGARSDLAPGDEPFELFRGFNEIFIVVGLVIVSMGWSGLVTMSLATRIADVQSVALSYGAAAAVILWLLAEYFTRRRRMIAPSIALTVLFAGNAAVSLAAGLSQPGMVARGDFASLPWPLILATGTLAVFWWRFRVPFALALIALGAFAVAVVTAAAQGGQIATPQDLFLLSEDGPFAWITLGLGLLVFGAAMAFDMSDPHRVTRRSANGFWLHVVAAPALVNTVALTLLDRGDRTADLLLLGLLVLFAIVAVVIDRRSFLIAATAYIVALSATFFDEDGAARSILGLGIGLLLLGAFWEAIRARLLRLIPGLPLDRLPPAHLDKGLT